VSASDALAKRDLDLSLRPALPDSLNEDAIRALPLQGEGAIAGSFGADVLARILASMPTTEQMTGSRASALLGAGRSLLLRQFVDATAGQVNVWQVDGSQAQRLGLAATTTTDTNCTTDTSGTGQTFTTDTTDISQTFTTDTTDTTDAGSTPPVFVQAAGLVEVTSEALLNLASAAEVPSRQFQIQPVELTLERGVAEQLALQLRTASAVTGLTIQNALIAISSRLVRAEGPTDISRDRINVPALGLVAKLDPAVTVTARMKGRLGVLPDWLRPDWFDDLRVQPVMAGPVFPFPMCQALYRYNKEWMIPGVAQIDRPDIVTLLKTNNEFIETFLVGLNHEMGRELLWRGYPTDSRGTYFKSFWTGSDELLQPVHAFTDVPLGGHMKPGLSNRIVMLVRGELVRRYPGVIAHAVREAGTDPATGIPLFEEGEGAPVLFRVHLAPNILLVAFDLVPDTVKQPGPAWWFLLSENPTEPRFGLDDVAAAGGDPRDNLTWAQLLGGAPAGRFLSASTPNLAVDGVTWGRDAAGVAHLLFQLPARAAFLGTRMLTNVGV
jgi:hypothetical protein